MHEANEIALIVENVEEWRQHIAEVVRKVFPDIKVLFAQDSNEAQSVLRETKDRVAFVLSDLHMTDDGMGNGDVLLASFMESSEETPPLGFVSGTLVDKLKKTLVEMIPGIPFLDKDAFLPMREGTLDRNVLEENIRLLRAQSRSSIPRGGPYIEALGRMKSPLLQPAKLSIFIDIIKAKIGTIWQKYAILFEEAGESAEFLKKPDLYGAEGDSRKIHDFKNSLSLLINLLHSREVQPVILDELSGLQVYINQVFNRLIENKNTDIVADIANACRNFNVFREGKSIFQ